jgi:Asp-tRNA(Asn)/Glu-tRNA(Gln) amidotransferase A subunit family amidase
MTNTPALELCFASITELGPRLARRDLSPVELTEAVLGRIERHDATMHAYITVTRDVALAQARQAEREIQSGSYRGPLHGIPIALKDNIATKGIRTSCASMVAPDWMPDHDATAYARLREAGAVLVGKTNLSEYAFSENPAYPQSRNPWHLDRTAGGSSSGSGVAVAAGMVHGALGTDTGGSVRYPAHVNGVVGVQGTYGRVSRHGVVPLSYSLDNVGVLTRCVSDSAIMLQTIAGHDPLDEHSSHVAVPAFAAQLGRDIRGLRVAYARGQTYQDIDDDVVAVMHAAREVFRDLGATIEDVRLPFVEHCVALFRAVSSPEIAEIHYDNLRQASEKLGEFGVMRLDLGSVIPAIDYIHAQRLRRRMRDAFRELFERYDVILGPARATRAGTPELPTAGAWSAPPAQGKEIDIWRIAPEYSGIYNLAGIPAIVIPAGFSSEGTPIGLQLAARWFDEATLLGVAHAYEQATDWHRRRPPYPATPEASGAGTSRGARIGGRN